MACVSKLLPAGERPPRPLCNNNNSCCLPAQGRAVESWASALLLLLLAVSALPLAGVKVHLLQLQVLFSALPHGLDCVILRTGRKTYRG